MFGTVHRHGWKALGVLIADGALPGGYATNESPAIAAWYLRRPQGCEGALAYVFRVPARPARSQPGRAGAIARRLPDARPGPSAGALHHRHPDPAVEPDRFGDIAAEAYAARFDRELASVWRPVGELYRADLGAATARRACVARNQPSRDSTDRR